MFVPIIASMVIVLALGVLVVCGVKYGRRKGEAKLPTPAKMSAKEMEAIAKRDQAWAGARELHGEIRALAHGDLAPAENPELCRFLAYVVLGDLGMTTTPALPCERTD